MPAVMKTTTDQELRERGSAGTSDSVTSGTYVTTCNKSQAQLSDLTNWPEKNNNNNPCSTMQHVHWFSSIYSFTFFTFILISLGSLMLCVAFNPTEIKAKQKTS